MASAVGIGLGSPGVVVGVTSGAGAGMGVGRTVEVGTATGDGNAAGRVVAVGGVVGLGSGVCVGTGDDVGGTEVVVAVGIGVSGADCRAPQASKTSVASMKETMAVRESLSDTIVGRRNFHLGRAVVLRAIAPVPLRLLCA